MDKIKNWLFAGSAESWKLSLSQAPLPWGFESSLKDYFRIMKSGDIAWFYVTKPVEGIIGYGSVKENYIDNRELLSEKPEHAIMCPLKVKVQVIKSLLPDEWETRCLKINDIPFMKDASLQILNPESAETIYNRSLKIFEANLYTAYGAGANIINPVVADKGKEIIYADDIMTADENKTTHKDTQNIIAEIGTLQNYYTQLEYPIRLTNENKNIDVVWKREITGVPTFAFEVELSGQIEKAVSRLKHAYVNWNSRPRIVIPNEVRDKLKNQISLEDKNFREQIKSYSLEEIIHLHRSKIALRDMEKQMELY